MDGASGEGPILARLTTGDAQSFELLFRRYADTIYNYCGRRTADWSDAEDLMSLVFLEAWRLRTRAHLVDGSLRPWLLGIALNVVRNASRSKRRYAAALQRYRDLRHEPVAGHEQGVVESVNAANLHSTAVLAIYALRPPLRDVAELCMLEGLSSEAVAAALGISASAVRSRLQKARSALRPILQTGELADKYQLDGHPSLGSHVVPRSSMQEV